MTDPVEVLARDLCCQYRECDKPGHCSREQWMGVAKGRIAALERAGFKVIERPLPRVVHGDDPFRDCYGQFSAFWDAAPTYGDKP